MNMPKTNIIRNQELKAIYDSQPYMITMENIRMVIEKGVFPPNFGITTKAIASVVANNYKYCTSALDVGCGSGYIALKMREAGIPYVVAADIDNRAIQCAKKNLELNPNLMPLSIIQSDLFSNVPKRLFDLVVFNQPFYPVSSIDEFFGSATGGGEEIIKKFLSNCKEFLAPNGKIVMSYASFVDIIHDPKIYAKEYGFRTRIILENKHDNNTYFVYEFSL